MYFRENHQQIGDIMVKFVPYLRMYHEYVMQAEAARALVTKYRETLPAFGKLLQSIEVSIVPIVNGQL